ncbi:hypothetical protein [Pedobacter mucosus]|uniref:hypothetical protein n=1 Tax=Pedobacter mucosus TaxID=2895286 RepID=UPI001EE436C3|nr:hypothetical protein [Pedobacter mucosus]UKT64500.1 hypothetical protein LOK61_01680 [Pedobacter mucosus]
MEQKLLTELTDEELLQEAKKMKTANIINALLIGVLIGILIFSFLKNSLGFLSIILVFFVYKLANQSKYKNKDLVQLLKDRNLM